jgi:hypothetical protein
MPEQSHILYFLAHASLCITTLNITFWKAFHSHSGTRNGMDRLYTMVSPGLAILESCLPLTIPKVPSAISLTILYSPSLFHGASGSGGATGSIIREMLCYGARATRILISESFMRFLNNPETL